MTVQLTLVGRPPMSGGTANGDYLLRGKALFHSLLFRGRDVATAFGVNDALFDEINAIALEMERYTKECGWDECKVYFFDEMLNGDECMRIGSRTKVGHASDVLSRKMNLQTGNPRPLSILTVSPGTAEHEEWIHAALSDFYIQGEWYRRKHAVVYTALRLGWPPEFWPWATDNGMMPTHAEMKDEISDFMTAAILGHGSFADTEEHR